MPDADYAKIEKEFDELQATFMQNVNHELRTPLAIILGYIGLLRDGQLGTLAPEQQQAVFVIANRALELQRSLERVSTLLSVKAQHIYTESISLTDTVAAVVSAYQARAVKSNLDLAFYHPATLPQVMGSSDQLKQAIDCLVENALKFTSAGGQIKVRIEEEADWIILSITDTGIGIAEEKLAHIFDPFYQIDGSTTRHYGGLGLGLTVAKAVVEAHGGYIEAQSQLYQGSLFTVK